MRLEDLQQSISEMSTEDLHELLKSVRHNRTSENVIQKKEKANKVKETEIQKLLKQLTPEQIASLLGGTE